MPIYEFYCPDCDTIFNFFSRRVNTQKIPKCPRCERQQLTRQMSIFSKGGNLKDAGEGPYPDIDEARLTKAMDLLGREAANINENDPKQAALLMRKMSQVAGLDLGPKLDEALSRMERGEDLESIEEDMKDALDSEEDLFITKEKGATMGSRRPPRVDETLYEL